MHAVDSFFSANGRLPNTDADAVKLKELGQMFFDQRGTKWSIPVHRTKEHILVDIIFIQFCLPSLTLMLTELDFTIVHACYDEMYDNTLTHSRAVFVFV